MIDIVIIEHPKRHKNKETLGLYPIRLILEGFLLYLGKNKTSKNSTSFDSSSPKRYLYHRFSGVPRSCGALQRREWET
jgi:hypothetical protein